ncbi:MAG: hypothetical protein RBU45_22965 [Myxococcota bacterium]|nr:hypothetical protein [Myxococcota bacterium]
MLRLCPTPWRRQPTRGNWSSPLGLLVGLTLLGPGCDDGSPGTSTVDAGLPDGGSLPPDAGSPDLASSDAGSPDDSGQSPDAGGPPDAGPPPDLGPPRDLGGDLGPTPDTGTPPPDGGGEEDSSTPSDGTMDQGIIHDLAPTDAGCEPAVPPLLTVNRVPATMNGSAPFTNLDHRLEPYHLLLPPAGFTLDLLGDGATTRRFGLRELGCGEQDWTAAAREVVDGWTVTAPAATPLPDGPTTCRARLQAPCGEEELVLTYSMEIGQLTPELDPFEDPETWLITLHRDHWTVTASHGPGGGIALAATPTPNGIPDLHEAMAAVGLRSDDSGPGAAELVEGDAVGASAVFEQRLVVSALEQLRGFFHQEPDGTWREDSVRIHFLVEGMDGAPDPADFHRDGTFSMIGVGGGDPADRNVGRSQIDWNNSRQNDDATDPDLGIFTTTMISLFADHPAAAFVLGVVAPLLGGTPIGQHPADAEILAPGFDPTLAQGEAASRGALLVLALDLLGRGLAALTAHEIGHSLGLVAYGPPPGGLFGGEVNGEFAAGPFTDAHIDTPGFNLMQQGFALQGMGMELLGAEPFFEELSLAYLQRRLIVDLDYPRQEAR